MKVLVNLNCLGDNSHRFDARNRYDEYDEMQPEDEAIVPLIQLLTGMSETFDIIVFTSMREKYRYQVEQWLTDNEVPADEVIFREDNDYSKNYELFTETVSGFDDVQLVIESDTRTIETLREAGYYVLEAE